MSVQDWRRGVHRRLPLIQEFIAAVSAPRCKRTSRGVWRDAQDRPVPTLLQVQVRGRSLRVSNDPRRLKMVLTTSQEDMTWFVGE